MQVPLSLSVWIFFGIEALDKDQDNFQKFLIKNERRQKWNNDTAMHSLLAEEAGPGDHQSCSFCFGSICKCFDQHVIMIQTESWSSALAATMPDTPRTDNEWNWSRMSATPFPTFGSPSDDDGTSPSPPPMDLPTRVYEAEAVVRFVSFLCSTSVSSIPLLICKSLIIHLYCSKT